MRHASLALAALVAVTLPVSAHAQRVVADIQIGSGPVDGRIIIGDPIPRYPRRSEEIDGRHRDRTGYREVEVYRVHGGRDWMRHRGYRAVTMWYDAERDRYFDRNEGDRDGRREVVIYERDGRYFDGEQRRGDYSRRHREHDRERDHQYHDRD